MDKSTFNTINLEHIHLNTRRYINDIPGVKIDTDLVYDSELRAAVMDIRARVLAKVHKEEPRLVEDRVESVTHIPLRPLRDSLWLWFAHHTPGKLASFFSQRARFRRIETRRVLMQEVTYYCCPHLAIEPERAHLQWLYSPEVEAA